MSRSTALHPRKHSWLAAVSLLAIAFGATTSVAQATEAPLDEALFPKLSTHTEAEIRLHGLAALYPGNVRFEAPELEPRGERTEATRVETLKETITYIRLYRLEEAMPVIRAHIDAPALILDFRYLESAHTGHELATILSGAKMPLALDVIGKVPEQITTELAATSQQLTPTKTTPTIVLCNRQTAGPFEALLHVLQTQGSIIAVGEPSAGRTGFHKQVAPQTWVIEGELRPDTQTSLVANGFSPRIQVNLSAEANYSAYHLYEAGTPPQYLLRQPPAPTSHNSEATDKSKQPPPPSDPEASDPILQRGVDIVTALQILQQLPPAEAQRPQ